MIRKKYKDSEEDFNDDAVLPLINIVFLLLIFFIVMGKFYHKDLKTTELAKITSQQKLDPKSIYIKMDIIGFFEKN